MLFTWAPGALILITATYASCLGLSATARELRGIRSIRLIILSEGTDSLANGSPLCTRLGLFEATSRDSPIKCQKTVQLRYDGRWADACPAEIPRLNPRRLVQIRTNCTWQIANHILRLPAVDYTFKR